MCAKWNKPVHKDRLTQSRLAREIFRQSGSGRRESGKLVVYRDWGGWVVFMELGISVVEQRVTDLRRWFGCTLTRFFDCWTLYRLKPKPRIAVANIDLRKVILTPAGIRGTIWMCGWISQSGLVFLGNPNSPDMADWSWAMPWWKSSQSVDSGFKSIVDLFWLWGKDAPCCCCLYYIYTHTHSIVGNVCTVTIIPEVAGNERRLSRLQKIGPQSLSDDLNRFAFSFPLLLPSGHLASVMASFWAYSGVVIPTNDGALITFTSWHWYRNKIALFAPQTVDVFSSTEHLKVFENVVKWRRLHADNWTGSCIPRRIFWFLLAAISWLTVFQSRYDATISERDRSQFQRNHHLYIFVCWYYP